MMPATSRPVRLTAPVLALVSAVWVSGCALPFLGGATKLDPKAVVAAAKSDSLLAMSSKVQDTIRSAVAKPAKAERIAKTPDSAAQPAKSPDSSKGVAATKPVDSLKPAPAAKVSDSVKVGPPKPEQLDPSERSRDPNAWSDLLMAGDTTAGRELSAVSRMLHRWYKNPVTPMLSAWPDLWGHVAELSLNRQVDTISFSVKDSNALVLDLRMLVGLRKFRAPRVGLDKKRLVSILVPSSLEEIDLAGNRLELLEVVAEGRSDLRQLDVSGNRLASLRLVGVAPNVLAVGNRLCSRLLGLPTGERADKLQCKDFPSQADSLGRQLLERWSKSALPGEIAPAKVTLVTDVLPTSFPPSKWTFPISASACAQGVVEARFWPFGVVGYDGFDALLVGQFPPLAKGKIRPGMARAQVQAVLGKPTRSQGAVDVWASEKTPDDRLWLGVRFFYDAEGRLEGVWIRKLAQRC